MDGQAYRAVAVSERVAAHNRRLVWRCRRGTKELDVMLERYLTHDFPAASSAELDVFERLLALPDERLAQYLYGHETPTDPALAALAALAGRIARHRP